MCGVFGIFNRDANASVDPTILHRMGESLIHRGPDGWGQRVDGPLGIGMRRLSIIDLSTGNQPIANEDGRLWVVSNGEIYNFRELRRTLKANGHRFTTQSDTEVIVHLYEDHGEDCVNYLRGMFAFAIWDASSQELFVARDRLGIKPLYYGESDRGFVFGSELRCIVESGWQHGIEPAGLVHFLQFGYVPDPLSIAADVKKLPPGHSLRIRQGQIVSLRRYWDPTAFFHRGSSSATFDEVEASEELWRRVKDAVESHLVSDVPLGAFLSGGIDSTTVVTILAALTDCRVKTFSVGFSEDKYNEAPFARCVSKSLGTDHHEIIIGRQCLEILEKVLDASDEPFADASAIPTYIVSGLARQHVKVVLSGDGGDEIFAGYTRYVVNRRRNRFDAMGLSLPVRLMSAFLPEGTPGKNFLHHMSLRGMERYLDSISFFPVRSLSRLLEPELTSQQNSPFQDAVKAADGLDPTSRLQAVDLRTYLPGDILTKLDRMSMAHSLEARVPFLDHRLVEFACSLPSDLRLRGSTTKYLLKRTLRGRVPEEILSRPKQGFGVPLCEWFSGDLLDFYRDQLGDLSRLAAVGVRADYVRHLVERHRKWRRPALCEQLWVLVVLDHYLRRSQSPSYRE